MTALEGVVDGARRLRVPAARGHRGDLRASRPPSTAASWALLVGSVPRKAGMERGDLLIVNGGIFKPQGQAIAANAASDVRVLVVGNPCNTNCLIARSARPRRPRGPVVRDDAPRPEPRRVCQLAQRAGVAVAEVAQRRDLGQPLRDAVPRLRERDDRRAPPRRRRSATSAWLQGEFLSTVQKRGAAIIEARGASSAASAANAAIDTVVSLTTPTPADTCASVAVTSTGEYGVPEGLTFGFPIVADGLGAWSVKPGFAHTAVRQREDHGDDRRAARRARRGAGARPRRLSRISAAQAVCRPAHLGVA